VTTTPLIEVRGLTKRFPLAERGKFVQACHRVSFTVGEGETVGLVGESGSGKTTVGRLLVRLLEPTEGEIHFRGERIDNRTLKAFRSLRSELQIVFQEPGEALNPRMTVARLVGEPLRLHGMRDERQRRSRISELLGQVGLGARVADAKPGELSSGNQQRVAIARALATSPRFIVLDEPTSSLPPDATSGILQLLRDLQRELGLSYLFISHDLSLVRHFCDRVAVMYLGQVVELGPLEAVFDDPQNPYSRALLASVLRKDPAHRRRDNAPTLVLSGEIPSPVDLPKACYLAGRCPIAKERCHHDAQELATAGRQQVRCWRITEGDFSWDREHAAAGDA